MYNTILNKGFIFQRTDSVNLALALTLLYVPLINYISDKFDRGLLYQGIQLGYFVFFINALPAIIKKIDVKEFIFIILYIICFVLSFVISGVPDEFTPAIRVILLWCIPYFLLSTAVVDIADLWSKLKVIAILMLILGTLRTFTLNFSSKTYSQDLGYDILLPFMVYAFSFLKRYEYRYIFPMLFALALMFMSGSRGPLFCALLGFSLAYFSVRKIDKKTLSVLWGVFIMYILYSIFRDEILTWLLKTFKALNVSTRSIEFLLNSDIGKDESRVRLREVAWDYIINHPLLGTGFINDRAYIYSQYIINKTATIYGSYCHNFFLELMMQFGMIPGLLLIGIFLRISFRTFAATLGSIGKEYFVLVFTIGFFPLMVSRSWVTFHVFYLVLGTLFSLRKFNYNEFYQDELSL